MSDDLKIPALQMTNELRLKVDWKKLAENLVDVAVNGIAVLVGKVDAAISVGAALGKIATTIGPEDDPGQRAWVLFWKSFAWSLDFLAIKTNVDEAALKAAIRDAIQEASNGLSEEDLLVPITFLERPTTLPIYKKIRDKLIARKAAFRFENGETDTDLAARFDTAFSRAVSEVLIRNVDAYQALVTALQVPGLEANYFQLQWENYRRALNFDFEVRPMFGQEQAKISLSQAYIPLRCRWNDASANAEGVEVNAKSYGYLDDILEQWVQSDLTLENSVKLIGGGPGSGKSTSAKRLASTLAKRPGIRPLYVPMQHLSLDGNLRDAINQFFVNRTNGYFVSPPLSRESIEDGSKLVIIFDGLDEIARPGDGADDIANLFVSKLEQLISSLKGDSSTYVPVIVTGRLPSFQAAKRYRSAMGQAALEVLGYAPVGYVASDAKGAQLTRHDQRPEWWAKYAVLAGLQENVPVGLIDHRLTEITSEPLLCYLLVLSGFVIDNWEAAADNRNLIYERLINEVWQRGWGDPEKQSDRQGAGRRLGKDQFNQLMETIALAAWLGGDTRVASEDTFDRALKIADSEDAWADFNLDGGEDVANLAMNFYLKASEGVRRGFEFTHKSFGDYLAARAILKLAESVASHKPRYIDLALAEWFLGTSTGVMTAEIALYMRDEVRLRSDVSCNYDKTVSSLQELIKLVLSEGLPAHKEGVGTWRTLSKMQKNSEVSLWCATNAFLRGIQADGKIVRLDVGFSKDKAAFKLFLARTVIGDDSGALKECMSHLSAANSDLFGLELSDMDFTYSDFQEAVFSGTHLMRSKFDNTDLRSARFQRANLDNCSFAGAHIEKSDFRDARLSSTKFLSDTEGDINISVRCFLDFPAEDACPEDRLHFDAAEVLSDRFTHDKDGARELKKRFLSGLAVRKRSLNVSDGSFSIVPEDELRYIDDDIPF